jgi:hypothetical protein
MTKSFDGCLPVVPTWWINANFGRVLEGFKDQKLHFGPKAFLPVLFHISSSFQGPLPSCKQGLAFGEVGA